MSSQRPLWSPATAKQPPPPTPRSLTHSLIATTVMLASASAAKLPQVLSFLPSFPPSSRAEERALSSSSCNRGGRSVCKFNEKFDVVRRAVAGGNLYFVVFRMIMIHGLDSLLINHPVAKKLNRTSRKSASRYYLSPPWRERRSTRRGGGGGKGQTKAGGEGREDKDHDRRFGTTSAFPEWQAFLRHFRRRRRLLTQQSASKYGRGPRRCAAGRERNH